MVNLILCVIVLGIAGLVFNIVTKNNQWEIKRDIKYQI
jgi:hypothetical protein